MSNHVGFQHFLGEDCYSHQGQLLPAGCWKQFTWTKTWMRLSFGPPRMRSSRHPPCAVQHIQYLFLQKWEKLSNHHIEKCLVTKCQLPLIKSKRTVHPTWTLCFFWSLGTFAFMLMSHVHSALEQRGTHQSLAAVHGTHTHHCFELIYLTNKKSTI